MSALIGVAALALTACGQGTTGDGAGGASLTWDDLAGRTFLSSDVTKDGQPYPLVKGSTLRLTFTADGIGASGGCNHMGGTASLDGDVLVVDGPMGMTEMACDEPLMAQDTWLADLLAARPALTLSGDSLTLATDVYRVSLTDEETVNPDRALEGTDWQLSGLLFGSEETGAVSSVPDGVTATITFDAGRVSGNDGCNRFNGDYTLGAGTVTISRLATTKMACTGPADEVERSVMAVLSEPMAYSIDGDQLALITGGQGLYYTAR